MHSVQCLSCKQLIGRPPSLLSLALCRSCGTPLPRRRHLVSVVRSTALPADALPAAKTMQSSTWREPQSDHP